MAKVGLGTKRAWKVGCGWYILAPSRGKTRKVLQVNTLSQIPLLSASSAISAVTANTLFVSMI